MVQVVVVEVPTHKQTPPVVTQVQIPVVVVVVDHITIQITKAEKVVLEL
jgi:hypothetical protein